MTDDNKQVSLTYLLFIYYMFYGFDTC